MFVARGRVAVHGTTSNWTTELLARSGVAVVELSPAIAELATSFGPDYSHDPADQLIGATARAHGMSLITADAKLRESPLLRCVW